MDMTAAPMEPLENVWERIQAWNLRTANSHASSKNRVISEQVCSGTFKRVSELSDEAARLICRRSARNQGGKFVWRSDSALNWVSAVRMTEGQVLDLLGHLECPVLIMQATTGPFRLDPQVFEARKNAIPNARHVLVEGHHHFHMDQPAAIADTIEQFILQHDSGPKAGKHDD